MADSSQRAWSAVNEMVHGQLKDDGRECRVWYCLGRDPKFPVAWKCEAGHRDVLWYCGRHGWPMMAAALRAVQEDAGIMCRECAPMALMKLTAEPSSIL